MAIAGARMRQHEPLAEAEVPRELVAHREVEAVVAEGQRRDPRRR